MFGEEPREAAVPVVETKVVNKAYLKKPIIKKQIVEETKKEEEIVEKKEVKTAVKKRVANKKGYEEVYKSFSEYRDRRTQSREMFVDDKKMHKFLKTIEGLGLKSANEDDTKRENANVDGDTAMGTMLQYGSTVSKEFAKSYMMKKRFWWS